MNAVGLGIINYYLCFYMRIDTSLREEESEKEYPDKRGLKLKRAITELIREGLECR
ncbi:MAG: hypothetical protein Q6356_012035 [Candidatus Wukongarchaeota archaeon]|nr:hypothetical protein [Candidatus Wukongarchaeota archaeon]